MRSKMRNLFIVLILSLAMTITACDLISSQSQLERMISSGKYTEALDYYLDHKSDIKKQDAAQAFEEALDNMYEGYLAGTVEADDIEDYIDDLERVGSNPLDSYGSRILENITEIEISRDAFEDAETLFASSNYSEALLEYRLVIREDPNYETAQTRIDECIENYKTEMMQEAADYAGSNNYESAIDTLNELTAVIGSDSDVTDALNNYYDQHSDYLFQTAQEMADSQQYDEAISFLEENNEYIVDETQYDLTVAEYEDSAAQLLLQSNNVAELVSSGDYDNAFSILNTIGQLYPNAESYIQQLSETEDAYTEAELAIIQGFIDDSDYESAYDECVSALNRVPGRSELVTQRDYCEQRLPVSLDVCFNSGETMYDISAGEIVTDLFGNSYDAGSNCFVFYEDNDFTLSIAGTADYYLNCNYDVLTLAITPEDEYTDGYTGTPVFRIYGDDDVIYEQTVSNRSTPTEFEVNVSGVTWLTLEYEVPGPDYVSVPLIIVNPELSSN
ncbi:MAG: hypothetical protein IKN80_07035 [Clostridiales bacterium]|nr:hypothetical protein [Clostridiales bacterium]